MYADRHLSATRALLAIATLAITLGLSGCKSSAPSAPTDDASLTAALQSRISSDNALTSESIQSSVQNSVATLTGNVSSEAARSLAAADAAQVAGIKTVVNNLSVQAPAPAITAAAVPLRLLPQSHQRNSPPPNQHRSQKPPSSTTLRLPIFQPLR
ncbi:BON domain-containing protein [Tunturiibacter gelidiferens]|uniref:BON domain-containing protein n=1 Tax=Tunturiibacter gelidiferens TaxID=3069689 RepID=UPI003D9AC8BF